MRKFTLFIILLFGSWTAFSQGMPVREWSKFQSLSNTGIFFESIDIDKWGNSIAVGGFNGTQDFDPGVGVFNLTSNGVYDDVFVLKLDSNGNFIWAKSFGGFNKETVFSVKVDTFGNIYTLGQMKDVGDYDPGPAVFMMGIFAKQVFVSKLDMNGDFLWAKTIPNTDYTYTRAAAFDIDNESNVYMFGVYHDTVDFDPGPNIYNLYDSSGISAFLLKLDSNGDFVWVQDFNNYDSNCEILLYSVHVDKKGDVLITGSEDMCNLAINGSFSYSLATMFVAKFNSAGNYLSQIHLGANFPGNYFPLNAITTDSKNNIYIAISASRDIVFFDYSNSVFSLFTNSGVTDLDIAKYDSSGHFLWAKQIKNISLFPNTSGILNNNCLAIDSADNLIVSGRFCGTVDFDMGPNVHNETANIFSSFTDAAFLYKIDSLGNYKWVYKSGKDSIGSNNFFYKSIALDNKGKIYTVGIDPIAKLTKFADDPCALFNIHLDSTHSVICGNAAYIEVSAHDGSYPYSYQWNSGQTTPIITPTSGGIYTVVVHDTLGCADTASYFISAPTFPNTYFDLNSNFLNIGSLTTWSYVPFGLNVFNDGCVSQSGTVKLVLDSTLNYYSAFPAPSQVLGDTVVWSFSNLNYNSPHFQPHVTADLVGNLGDTVCITSIVEPIINDANPSNNVKTSCYLITGSWDPNDITVYPQGACDSGYVLPNTTFTYTINFQNLGNAPAKNIYVLDSLDSGLDLDSMEVLGSSHKMYTEVLPGQVLKFVFKDINLPASSSNDSASHGNIIFSVKTKNNIALGSLIKNHASIYLDNNPPVVTNEVFNKVVVTIPNCITSISSVEPNYLTVSPNPFNESFEVTCPIANGRISVIDVNGKLILTKKVSKLKQSVDLKGVASGVYFVKFDNGTITETVKILKQ